MKLESACQVSYVIFLGIEFLINLWNRVSHVPPQRSLSEGIPPSCKGVQSADISSYLPCDDLLPQLLPNDLGGVKVIWAQYGAPRSLVWLAKSLSYVTVLLCSPVKSASSHFPSHLCNPNKHLARILSKHLLLEGIDVWKCGKNWYIYIVDTQFAN